MWQESFQVGEARIDGALVWGTAMYRDDEAGQLVFRRHKRNIGISPGHNPPLPDPGSEVIPAAAFTPRNGTEQ